MRPGDAQAHGYLPGGIVKHGAGVMMMGPVGDVVVVPLDIVYFVFGLDGTMLGQADIHAGSVLGVKISVQAGIE